MKLLYGVQGTGQGHISRARAMAIALKQLPIKVTWLFSGRPRNALFDMEVFGEFEHRRGLSFTAKDGRVRHGATIGNNNLPQFLREVKELDLGRFDLIVSDYEPVVSRAASRQNRKLIGIGHQYAFGCKTPRAGASWLQEQIMARFAPVDIPIGLHWHPYSDNILPPILDLPDLPVTREDHVLVYLPFENQDVVTNLLRLFPERQFIQYSPDLTDQRRDNVLRRKANVSGFKNHLSSCSGVICNSGFELISECLQWRKPVLTKPLDGQMEQHANALALHQLGYATTVSNFTRRTLDDWLNNPPITPAIGFPDVAQALARWLATGCSASPAQLSQQLWQFQVTDKIPVPRACKKQERNCAAA